MIRCLKCGHLVLTQKQQEILKTIAEQDGLLWASKIAVIREVSQAAIWRGIAPLIKNGLVVINEQYPGGPKLLAVTMAGREYLTA